MRCICETPGPNFFLTLNFSIRLYFKCFICVCICIYIYTHYMYTYVWAWACMCVCMQVCMCMHVHACVTAVLDKPSCQEPSSSSLSHYVFLQACDRLIMPFMLLWNRNTLFTKDIRSHLVKYLSLIQQPPSRTQVCWEETLDHTIFHEGWTLFWLSQLSLLALPVIQLVSRA